MKKWLIFFVSIISFDLCTDSINETENNNLFELSDTITVNYKQTFYNSDQNLSIQFYSLVSDSRCPEDVVCVWEGDAEIKFKLTKGSENIYFSLHTAANYFNTDTTIWNYNISLLKVNPYPKTFTEPKADEYSAVIKISNN